ncbi:DUF6492 family protein [Desulfovibrio sp. OttesenSCG-928-I05]|nr:DUF6492 family protein [Desulfovibrio sp. OttesenSCG-928-I05]
MRYENLFENPFARYAQPGKASDLRIFPCDLLELQEWLGSPDIKKYDVVFVCTTALWDKDYRGFFPDFLKNRLGGKYGLLMVEHSPQIFVDIYHQHGLIRQGRLFSLGGYENVPQLNPHYFCSDIKATELQPAETIHFAVVGGMSESCKDSKLLINTVAALIKQGYNFKVTVIGSGTLTIPDTLSRHVAHLGRIDFAAMYEEVEKTHFMLALLNPDNVEQRRYMQGTTTGALQLSIGFDKPLIINEQFARHYGFDDNSAIIYEGNELASAMIKAMSMTQERYGVLVHGVTAYRGAVHDTSLQNMRGALEHIKQQSLSPVSSPSNFCMFCKSWSGDFHEVKRMLESFHRFNFDNILMWLSVPEHEIQLFADCACDTVRLISDESYAGSYLSDKKLHGLSVGYINQQICKLAFWETGNSPNYLCVDSDSLFIRDFFVRDFMADEETPYTVLFMDKDLSVQKYYQEMWNTRQAAVKSIYSAVGLEDDTRLRTCHGAQVLNAEVLSSLKNVFMKNNSLNYVDLMNICPLEFTWYNAWFQKCGLIKELAVEPFLKMFHMAEEYTIAQAQSLTASDFARAYVGIIMNSNWAKKKKAALPKGC